MEKLLNLRLMAKKMVLDERTKEYIFKRIFKMEKFLKKTLQYEVEVAMDKKGLFLVEIMVKTPRKLYRSEEISQSVEGSVDMAVEEIQRQIVRDGEKVRDLRERGARSLKKRTVLDEKSRF